MNSNASKKYSQELFDETVSTVSIDSNELQGSRFANTETVQTWMALVYSLAKTNRAILELSLAAVNVFILVTLSGHGPESPVTLNVSMYTWKSPHLLTSSAGYWTMYSLIIALLLLYTVVISVNYVLLWRGLVHKMRLIGWLAFGLQALRYVLVFPITAFLTSTLRCRYQEEALEACWGTGGLLLNLSIIFLMLWCLTVYMVPTTSFFVVSPFSNVMAQNSGILQILLSLFVYLHVTVVELVPDGWFPITSGIVGLGYGVLLLIHLWLAPYYILPANFLAAWVLGSLFGGNIMNTLLYYTGAASGTTLGWAVLGSSAGIGVVAMIVLLVRLLLLQFAQEPGSAWAEELRLRTFGFRWNGVKAKRKNVVLDGGFNVEDPMCNGYEDALQKYPTSTLLRLSYLTYLRGAGVDDKLILAKLKEVQRLRPMPDLEFLAFARMRQFAQREEVELADISKMLRKATNQRNKVKILQQTLWRLVLKRKLTFKKLSLITRRIHAAESSAASIYHRLRSRFPNNANILRAYALFTEDVQQDLNTAMALYAQADELEEEQTRITRGGLSNAGSGIRTRGALIEDSISSKPWGEKETESSSNAVSSTFSYRQQVSRKWKATTLVIRGSTTLLLVFVIVSLLVSFAALFTVLEAYHSSTDEFVAGCHVMVNSQLAPARTLSLQIHSINRDQHAYTTTQSHLQENIERFQERVRYLAASSLSFRPLAERWLHNIDVPLRFWREEQHLWEEKRYTLWKASELYALSTLEVLDKPKATLSFPNITHDFDYRFLMDNGYQTLGPNMVGMVDVSTDNFDQVLQERLVTQSLSLTFSLVGVIILFIIFIMVIATRVVQRLWQAVTVFHHIPKKQASAVLHQSGYNHKSMEHDNILSSLGGLRVELQLLLALGVFLGSVILFLALILALQLMIYARLQSHAESIRLTGSVEYHLTRSMTLMLQDVIGFDRSLSDDLGAATRDEISLLENRYRDQQFGTNNWEGTFGQSQFDRLFFGDESCNIAIEDLAHATGDYEEIGLCLGIDRMLNQYIRTLERVRDRKDAGEHIPTNSLDLLLIINMEDIFSPLTDLMFDELRALRDQQINSLVAAASIVTFLGIPILVGMTFVVLFPAINRLKSEGNQVTKLLLMLPQSEINQMREVSTYLMTGKVRSKSKDNEHESTRSIIEAAADGVVMFDDSGVISEINDAAEKLFAASSETVLGKKLKLLIREHKSTTTEENNSDRTEQHEKHHKDGILNEILNMRRGTSLKKEVNLLRMNDAVFPAQLSVSCGYTKGQRHFALFVRDVSEENLRQQLFMEEKEKSEKLLLNILPKHIAQRLQAGETDISDAYEHCTILFMDMVSFTSYSSSVGPRELVSVLNKVFSRCDEIVQRHGVEKIKTIGDAYMAVCGLEYRADHAEATIEAALEILVEVEKLREDQGIPLQFRVGINSGKVVGGVIGKEKFQFDIWGDDVNLASRMESHGLAGRVQVSRKTYELVHNKFYFEERTINVKGKGEMQSYICLGHKDKTSS